MNVIIVDAFIVMKKYAFSSHELHRKMEELERKHSKHFKDVYEALNYLLEKDRLIDDQQDRKLIGF